MNAAGQNNLARSEFVQPVRALDCESNSIRRQEPSSLLKDCWIVLVKWVFDIANNRLQKISNGY